MGLILMQQIMATLENLTVVYLYFDFVKGLFNNINIAQVTVSAGIIVCFE